jgi:hypothetical protein
MMLDADIHEHQYIQEMLLVEKTTQARRHQFFAKKPNYPSPADNVWPGASQTSKPLTNTSARGCNGATNITSKQIGGLQPTMPASS